MSSQANDLIRLGAFIIPILVLLIAGQALRFDPNRRVTRISVTREAVHPFEQPWGYFIGAIRWFLVVLLLLDIVQIALMSLQEHALLALLPAWATFSDPNGSAIYATLALLALWIIRRLKYMSMNIFDLAFETHLDFADWRTVDVEHDTRPALHLGNWRYEMKWNFKTNPEAIDALHMRMILECPTFAEFKQCIEDDKYPPGFAPVMQRHPYGPFLGTTRKLMHEAVLEGIYQSGTLWDIWENQMNPQTNMVISSKAEMADMLYNEIRSLIVCTNCKAAPEQVSLCTTCHGSGAVLVHCTVCHGSGLSEKTVPCKQCGGLGLHHKPIPVVFMNRLQYFWMARNVDYLTKTFPVWLSYLTYFAILGVSTALFLGGSLVFQSSFSPDLLVEALLFGAAALLGSLGAAIVIIFASAFNGSGILLSSYPLRDVKFGNHIWIQLMNLLALFTFSALLIDSTFALSQFLFASTANVAALIVATSVFTLFLVMISFGGFYSIHTAMRDTKKSRLDELADWLHQHPPESDLDTTQEEEFFKEIRNLQEWPIDIAVSFGIISGILIPVTLSLGTVITGYLSTFFHHL